MTAPYRAIRGPQPRFWTGPRFFALGATAIVLAIFVGANAHLIAVSFASRPDCALSPSNEGVAALRPAKPSC